MSKNMIQRWPNWKTTVIVKIWFWNGSLYAGNTAMECITPKHGIMRFLKWNEKVPTNMDWQTSKQKAALGVWISLNPESNQTSFGNHWTGTKHGQASPVILKKPVDTSILWASQHMVQLFTSNSCPRRMTSMHSTVFPQHFLTWIQIKQKWLADTCYCDDQSGSQRRNLHTSHVGATRMWIIQPLTWGPAIYFTSTQLKGLPSRSLLILYVFTQSA